MFYWRCENVRFFTGVLTCRAFFLAATAELRAEAKNYFAPNRPTQTRRLKRSARRLGFFAPRKRRLSSVGVLGKSRRRQLASFYPGKAKISLAPRSESRWRREPRAESSASVVKAGDRTMFRKRAERGESDDVPQTSPNAASRALFRGRRRRKRLRSEKIAAPT